MKRIKTSAPELPETEDGTAERFVFDESDPAIQRLIAAGVPIERLIAADSRRDATDE